MRKTDCEILLVEDDPADAELTLLALRQENLVNSVHHVRDGEDALDFLYCRGAYQQRSPSARPRLILLDLKLPKVDGLEVLRCIKADAALRTIPIAILTSSREESDLIAGYNHGANSYIQKPVSFEQFRRVVKDVGLYWLVVNHVPPSRDPVTG